MAALGRKDIKIGVDVDRSSIRDLNNTTRAATGAGGAVGGLGKSLRKTGGEFLSFKSRIPVLQLGLMGTAAYNAAGGVISLAGALAPMSGLLGAIGPLATSAAQGLGTIKLATSGLGDTISAAFAEQDKAASGAVSSLKANEAATAAVADAQRAAKFAQEDLNQARADGTRELEDMRAAVRSLSLEEEGQVLSLKEAKQAFRELVASGASDLELDRASLSIREAREELKKTRQEARRSKKDLRDANAAGGVAGLPQVVQAKRSLADANRAVKEASDQATEAMSSGGAAANAFQEKLAKLPPAGQKFAKFIIGLRPQVKQLQATAAKGLFPGVERGIKAAMKNFPVFNRLIAGTSRVLGDIAEQAGKRLGSKEWGKDIETQGKRNERTIGRLGTAGLNLAEAFKDVTLAAGPLVDRLTKWVVSLTEGWKQSANASRESGRLQRFFKDAGDTFFKTVRILRDLTLSFKNIGSAARKAFGNELLSGIERGAAGLRKWTESARGQRELVAIFTDIGERLKRVGGFIKDLFGDFRQMRAEGKSAGDALGQVFLTAVAKVIENAGELGVKFVKAFVRGFINADVGGKLILAAFTLHKFGLLGRTVGAVFGAGVTQGAAASVVGGGVGGAAAGGGLLAAMRTKLLPLAKRVGLIGVGVALADSVFSEFNARAAIKGPDALAALREKAKGTTVFGVPLNVPGGGSGPGSILPNLASDIGSKLGLRAPNKQAKELVKSLEAIQAAAGDISSEHARRLREEIEKIGGLSPEARDQLLDMVHAAETAFDGIESGIFGLNNTFDSIGNTTKDVARIADRNLSAIGERMGFHTKRGADAVRDNFRAVVRAMRNNLEDAKRLTKTDFAAIRQLAINSSRDVRSTTKKNFADARDFIRDAIHDGKISSVLGLKDIRQLWIDELKFYGYNEGQAINILKARKDHGKRSSSFHTQTDYSKARGGLVQFGAPGAAGRDTISAQIGGQKVKVGSGEVAAVINRHQMPILNARLSDFGGLPGFFKKVNREHFAAKGGIVARGAERVVGFARGGIARLMVSGPDGGPKTVVQAGLDRVRESANDKLAKVIARVADSIDPGNLPKGVGAFDGKAVAKWIIPYLVYGRQHGWTGSVTSGFRSFAEQTAIYNSGVRPAAVPGTSNHEGSQYPRGAVDVTLAEQLASILAGKPGPHLLEFAGAKDPVHFSHPHGGSYQAGGLVASMLGLQRGGFVRTPINIAADAARKAGFKGGLLRTMLAIAGRESGWNPKAANYVPPDHSIGLWQINQLAHHGRFGSDAQLMDPYVNARAARQLYKASGLSPWKGGSYESWIDEARGAVQATKGGGGPARDKKPDGDKARRAKRLDAFKKRIGKLRLPSKLQGDIARQIERHNQFSEFALRASGLSTETDERTGVAILKKVGNFNEGGWWVKDLGVLTKLRNNLLRVRTIILQRKAKIEAALKLAQERLKKLSRKGTTPRRWKGLNPAKDPIAKWNKQPAEKRKKRVREWHKMGGHLPGDREFTKDDKLLDWPGGRRKTLQSMISVLKNQRSILLDPQGQHGGLGASGISGTVLGSLFDVQGYATGDNTFKRYSVLPSGGMFGGYIGTAQDALAALGESLKPQADSSAGSDLFDSGRADRLAELLGLERQRALVRDTEVAELLRSARMPPFAGVFHQGGVVPGPVGAERLALVQGGEVVIPANGGADGRPVLNVTFADGMGWLRKFVKVEVDHTLHRESRSVGRVPGIPT